MTLYFAKLNLVSDNIFELYDNPNQRNAISRALYEAIKRIRFGRKKICLLTLTESNVVRLQNILRIYYGLMIHILI